MKKVHSKAEKAIEKKETPLHFKLEIIGAKANIELHGKANEMVNGICSAMEQKPGLARIIVNAAFDYCQGNNLVIEQNPKTQE